MSHLTSEEIKSVDFIVNYLSNLNPKLVKIALVLYELEEKK